MGSDDSKPSTLKKCSVYLGIHMMGIFCNVPWVWGNLSVYCSSYFYSKSESNKGEVAPWLVSINTIGLTIGVIGCDKLRQWFGLRGSLAIGMTVFNAGVFFSYFSVQHSLVLLDFTLGLFPGLGMGIIQACQYTLVVRWTTSYQGLATSSVESTCVLGSVFINQIITFFINPDNVVSDLEVWPTKLFSQQEILERVPSVFIVYGIVSVCVNSIGFFFLARDKPGDDMFVVITYKKVKSCLGMTKTTDATSTIKSETSLLKESSSDVSSVPIGKEIVGETAITNNTSSDITETEYARTGIESTIGSSLPNSIRSAELSFSQKSAIVESGIWISPTNDQSASIEIGPRQILKTQVFYTLWLTMAVADFTFIVLTTYYKAFGLVYIHDDHFLTYIGTLMCIGIAVISYAGGMAVDQIGVKDAIVVFVGVMGIISSLFYITPSINQWLYLIFCTVYGAFDFGIICMLSSCALKLWGQKHLSTNYGLLLSACVMTNTVLPPVIELLLLTYGWLTLFTTVSVCIVCCTILCTQIPRT